MTRSMISKLDAVLTALEELVLAAPNSELIEDRAALVEAQDVRKLINRKIKIRRSVGAKNPQTKPKPLTVLPDLAGRLAVLRELALTRPELKPRLGLVFGAKGRASADKVNDLVDELIRAGILKKER